MTVTIQRSLARWGLVLTAAAALLAAFGWGSRAAAAVFAGGVWNLASLGCLSRLLQAWLGPKPSQRQAIAWLIVKFPLLYAVIFAVFYARALPFAAFGVGFSVVLLVALTFFAVGARQTMGAAKP